MSSQSNFPATVDLLVIGGGINGTGIARDAAGRGLSVLLCEQGDLAGATSSASTKLIHGGLRYLEYGEFRLVREALIEREVLLRMAPHIIRPLRFVLPHAPGLRPAWMLRLGLFLYDHLGGRKELPGSESLDFPRHEWGAPLRPDLRRGFAYSDCWVEDARLVVLNAMDAARRGATIRTRTRLERAERHPDGWRAMVQPLGLDGQPVGGAVPVQARALVNTAGPWVGETLGRLGVPSRRRVRLVKGSHIIVPRLYDGPQAFILQHVDKRIVFVIPYERDYSLIGTTDVDYTGDPSRVAISAEEEAYLCAVVSAQFRQPVTPDHIVWRYSGVRPLYDDAAGKASAVTRDYLLDLDDAGAPVLSAFGGKITTYRRLAEHALDKLAPLLGGRQPGWTAGAILPGGDLPGLDRDALQAEFAARRPDLPPSLLRRWVSSYGTCTNAWLDHDLGRNVTSSSDEDVYEAELEYLRQQEWACCGDDVLWRRSKLGLHLTATDRQAVADWYDGKDGAEDSARNSPRS